MTDTLELPRSGFSPREVSMAYAAIIVTLSIVSILPILFSVSESSISPNATVFNRFWIATLVLGLWNGRSLLKKQALQNSPPIKQLPDIHNLLLLLILAIIFVGFQLLWACSLTKTSVANSEVLHSLTPLFTTLIGWSLLGQKFDRVFLTGIAIALAGSIGLAANDFSIAVEKLGGDGLALLSAMFWAGYLLVLEKLQTQLSIMTIITGNCLLGTLFLLPILLVTRDEPFPHSFGGWLIAIILGLTVILIQGLIAYSLKRLSSGLVAAILLLNPILTAILAWIIFSETLNLLNWLAFAIVLLGIYLTTLSKYGIKTQ